jgi:hypothetical protein
MIRAITEFLPLAFSGFGEHINGVADESGEATNEALSVNTFYGLRRVAVVRLRLGARPQAGDRGGDPNGDQHRGRR